jgi:uncharacterized membrane protein YcaP (DUF421 family)
MWNSLMHFDVAPLNLLIRAVAVYLSVLILLRISGKKQMGQMGATEFVAILLISNAVQNSMNGGDNSLSGGLLLAAVLIALSALISYLTYRSKFFTSVFEGTPTLMIHNGKMISPALKREQLSDDDLRTLLRKQGVQRLHFVKTAILESDGKLTIIMDEDAVDKFMGRTPVKKATEPKSGPKDDDGDDCAGGIK